MIGDCKEVQRLVFNNAEAIPKSSVLDITAEGVYEVCSWYAGFFAGDRYTITLNGRNLPLDLNGEPIRNSNEKELNV